VIPPEQRETRQQLAGFLRSEGAALTGPQDQVRVGATLLRAKLGVLVWSSPGQHRLQPRDLQALLCVHLIDFNGKSSHLGRECRARHPMRVMRSCFAAPIMAWSKADDRRRVSETKLEELAPAEDLILERRSQQPAVGNRILGA
jgi:hypothetical protein